MLLYATAIFLSAFLLFEVQPMIGKIILAWFGGSAAVWSTCLLFFQASLLAGYLYAPCSARYLKPRRQPMLHVVLRRSRIKALPLTQRNKTIGGSDLKSDPYTTRTRKSPKFKTKCGSPAWIRTTFLGREEVYLGSWRPPSFPLK
jgi:hypothetical protein